jgi:hypothetical protein
MGKFIDLTGKRFGRLTVAHKTKKPNSSRLMWDCNCDCGGSTVATSYCLKAGRTQSCGCLQRERTSAAAKIKSRTHGLTNHPLYKLWTSMRSRCNNPLAVGYERYGGIGVRVSKRWDDFPTFIKDIGPRPSPEHSLDRHPDPTGNYEPGNVRWATRTEQNNNKRDTTYVLYKNKRLPLQEARRLAGSVVTSPELRRRLRAGWPLKDALETPLRVYENPKFTHSGVSLTLREWAERTGISEDALRYRIAEGWGIRKALTTKAIRQKVIYRGQKMWLSQAIKESGSLVSLSSAWTRLKKGWSVERAVETPRTDSRA